MSERAKIAILGSATIDKIIKDLKISQKIGGTVIYGGITFQKHGLPTVLVTNIAQKDGRIFKTLDQLGTDLSATSSLFLNMKKFRDTILSRMHRISARDLYPRPRS